jgi:hypothetical protein
VFPTARSTRNPGIFYKKIIEILVNVKAKEIVQPEGPGGGLPLEPHPLRQDKVPEKFTLTNFSMKKHKKKPRSQAERATIIASLTNQ